MILKDSVYQEILEFFDNCELYGRQIPVIIDPLSREANKSPTSQPNRFQDPDALMFDVAHQTVSSEARHLKSLFLRLYD